MISFPCGSQSPNVVCLSATQQLLQNKIVRLDSQSVTHSLSGSPDSNVVVFSRRNFVSFALLLPPPLTHSHRPPYATRPQKISSKIFVDFMRGRDGTTIEEPPFSLFVVVMPAAAAVALTIASPLPSQPPLPHTSLSPFSPQHYSPAGPLCQTDKQTDKTRLARQEKYPIYTFNSSPFHILASHPLLNDKVFMT